jgi:hypothetical protein
VKFSRIASALLVLVIFGIGAFAWEILADDSGRAWQIFLINLLFFSAVAQSGPVFAAIYHLTEARWGGRVIRLALGFGSFLPISFVLFTVLLAGFPFLPGQVAEYPGREVWFQRLFIFGRNALGLAVLYSVSLAFLYRFLNASLRNGTDNDNIRETSDYETAAERRLTESRWKHDGSTLTSLAVAVLILYAVVFSLIGFDLVMALDHRWYSTLFGAYFFMSSFYVGLSAITVTVILARKYLQPVDQVQTSTLSDLAKLVFAFCLLTAYLLWSQYIVTWYGNLPEEVGFFILRMHNASWAWLTWTALALMFAVPFLALLSQRAKQNSSILCIVSIIALVGMWFERYLLVAPSLALTTGPRLGWIETITTTSFFAAMALSYGVYIRMILPRWTGARTSAS